MARRTIAVNDAGRTSSRRLATGGRDRSRCRCAAAARRSGRGAVPPGTLQPDQFLFDAAPRRSNEKKWLTAREFFKQVTETYTQSPLRPDAKLGIGDTYLGEGTAEALVLAINEFQEFLSFYPTNPRADYAQYKLGMAHFRQMRAPQRDQTETRDAIREFETFVDTLSEQRADAGGQGEAARGAGSPERSRLRGRPASTTGSVVSRRDRSVQGAAQGGSGVHRPRRACTSTWPNRW